MDYMRIQRVSHAVGIFASAVLAAPSANAQAVLFQWDGAHQNDSFGVSVATIPDISGDGIPDVLVGSGNDDCNATDAGAAYVYSGKDGTTLIVECGVGDGLGVSVAWLGDIDADGVADLLVGALGYTSSLGFGAGRACVYSGRSGAFAYQVEGEEQGNAFGVSVARVGDVDGDGRDDFIVGAVGYSNTTPSNIGRAYVFSGTTGSRIRYHEGEEEYDEFGWNVAGVGDVNADGIPDYAIMAMYDPVGEFGAVYVYSGASGTPLYKWTGPQSFAFFGYGLDGRLDWNGDGYGDVLVGSPVNLLSDGFVYIYSGKDGSALATVVGETYGTQFGYSVANVGDMNGDGCPEILVGEPLNSELAKYAGRATLLSGRTLRRLYHFYGAGVKNVKFGRRVVGGRDYDGDGIPDVLISEPDGSSQDPKGGRVTLFAGNDLFLQATPNEVTAGDALTIDTRGGGDGVLAALILRDVNGTSCFLPVQIGTLDGNGEMALSATVPSGLAGVTLKLQSYALRPAGQHGVIDSSPATISIY